MKYITEAVFIPLFQTLHYDCLQIEHVHPIFCAFCLLNLDIVSSTQPTVDLCVICS